MLPLAADEERHSQKLCRERESKMKDESLRCVSHNSGNPTEEGMEREQDSKTVEAPLEHSPLESAKQSTSRLPEIEGQGPGLHGSPLHLCHGVSLGFL